MKSCSLLPLRITSLVCLAAASASAGEIHFDVERQTIWSGRSQVVSFRIEPAATVHTVLVASVDDPDLVSIMRGPEVLAGEGLGYLRIRGTAVGTTRLRVGRASLELSVEATSAEAPANRITARIVAPAPRAVVWGTFVVGVEVTTGADPSAAPALAVQLRLPDGRLLDGESSPGAEGQAVLRARFDVDADTLTPGPTPLVVEVSRAGGSAVVSPAVYVRVVHPDRAALVAGECEDFLDLDRPQDYGAEPPRSGADPEASQGTCVVNQRSDPVWFVPLDVERPGRYQVFVRARGDFGAGAFPTVGLCVDHRYVHSRSVRLVDHRWQRVPVGPPLELEAGERRLTLRFMNDVSVSSTSDRNLFLDRFEILRLTGEPPRDAAPGMPAAVEAAARAESTGALGADATGLWVAFDRPLDGLPINGRLAVQGYCRWDAMDRVPAPRVDLLLNGEVFSSQQAARPLFALDRAAFEQGPNTLQLVAILADGRRAVAPVQTVRVDGRAGNAPARALHRFSVHDQGWGDSWKGLLSDTGLEQGQTVALPRNDTRAEIELPEMLAGDCELIFEARGPGEDAIVKAAIEAPAGEIFRGETTIRGWWAPRPGGVLHLPPGPKRLVLTFQMDPAGQGDPGRGLSLRAVLVRARRGPDRSPPRATVRYPAPGHEAFGVDAVVVEAFDDDRLASADVLIDGRPQGTFGRVPDGAGYVTLPLLLRGVAPGEHTLAVRVVDQAGNMGQSRDVPFAVLARAPAEHGPYARAVRLTNRFAFGPEPRELAALLVEGERAWLANRLETAGAGDAASVGLALAQRGSQFGGNYDRSVLAHALRTPNPVRARFCLWTGNHFSTWQGKTGAPSEWREHLMFLGLGPAPFGELLLASATSPTMLHYLDQAQSYAERLNENYAREIMELHTVGVDGGYDQGDVTTLAGLLCGLTLSQEAPFAGRGRYLAREFRFDPDLGDGVEREVLGLRFERTVPRERYDRFRLALELLAAHPATARFVCNKLAEHYVSVPAPDGLAEELAVVFTESGGDLRAVLLAIAEHPAFWSAELPARVTSPLDYGLRVGRASGLFVVDHAVGDFLRRSGMAPFDRATPDGYPEEDSAWVDTNALMQRWRLVQQIPWAVRTLVPDQLRGRAAGDARHWRQRVVDHAAVRLTGWTLGEESNTAALDFLEQQEGNSWQQVDRTALLVCRLPEASLK